MNVRLRVRANSDEIQFLSHPSFATPRREGCVWWKGLAEAIFLGGTVKTAKYFFFSPKRISPRPKRVTLYYYSIIMPSYIFYIFYIYIYTTQDACITLLCSFCYSESFCVRIDDAHHFTQPKIARKI